MKVGTDSIMLGSWMDSTSATNILDIGTGSGLLAIMAAQNASTDCNIVGIDINQQSIVQAQDNASASPWSDQLIFENVALQGFKVSIGFDLIVSNPPYFPLNLTANSKATVNLKPSNKSRIEARQTISLDHPTLLDNVLAHLTPAGEFCCILPFEVRDSFVNYAQSIGLFCHRELQIRSKPGSKVKRHLLAFGRNKQKRQLQTLNIYVDATQYSAQYIALCKEYYVNF